MILYLSRPQMLGHCRHKLAVPMLPPTPADRDRVRVEQERQPVQVRAPVPEQAAGPVEQAVLPAV